MCVSVCMSLYQWMVTQVNSLLKVGCVCVCVLVCVHVCVYVCVCVCEGVCVYVCVSLLVDVYKGK